MNTIKMLIHISDLHTMHDDSLCREAVNFLTKINVVPTLAIPVITERNPTIIRIGATLNGEYKEYYIEVVPQYDVTMKTVCPTQFGTDVLNTAVKVFGRIVSRHPEDGMIHCKKQYDKLYLSGDLQSIVLSVEYNHDNTTVLTYQYIVS